MLGGCTKVCTLDTSRFLASLIPSQIPGNLPPYRSSLGLNVLCLLLSTFKNPLMFVLEFQLYVMKGTGKGMPTLSPPEQKFSFMTLFCDLLWWKPNPPITECKKLAFFTLGLGVLKSYIIVTSNKSVRCRHYKEPLIVKETSLTFIPVLMHRPRTCSQNLHHSYYLSWEGQCPLLEHDLKMLQSFQSLGSLSTIAPYKDENSFSAN